MGMYDEKLGMEIASNACGNISLKTSLFYSLKRDSCSHLVFIPDNLRENTYPKSKPIPSRGGI
jgi:hypothetical protein